MGGERLTLEQVGLLRAWIDQGAEWPEQGVSAKELPEVRSKHWAFLPPQRPPLPEVRNQPWVRNPIDAFVLAKLEAEGIEPSEEANRVTLIRRISFDLAGLPPTPEEVAQFLADQRPGAYERLVERLLASPQYGEKWARQWLDLAHYADSDGYSSDYMRPHAWQWRDWVIQSLNRNMPFDEFTVEQIAGDLLPNATLQQKIATGFLRNTLTNKEGGNSLEEDRVKQVVDRTSTVGTVWLGMTFGCAVCHDHKYDPIAQKEFYQLYAFFNTAIEQNIEAPRPWELGAYLQRRAEYDKKRKALLGEYKIPELQPDWERKTLAAGANPGLDASYDIAWDLLEIILLPDGQEILRLDPDSRTPKQRDRLTHHFIEYSSNEFGAKKYKELKFRELRTKSDGLKEEYPGLSEAQILVENPDPPKTHILIRGDYKNPGVEVRPGTPAVMNPLPQEANPSRLDLARWLATKNNPLTARVWVNRAWQELFGRGLVETSGDFGARGEQPTHPELLDWLATKFMGNGWNMKGMHRLMVESATYRQSAKVRDDLRERDAYNNLLARQVRLRLPAESVRDAALTASGLLNQTIGGKSARPPMPPGVMELNFGGKGKWKESTGADRYRRGLYTTFVRTTPYPQLVNFDAPDSLESCTRRERSITPLQALNLLNDPVFVEAAQVMAVRILREQRGNWNDRLTYAFRLSLGREPRPLEKRRMVSYYKQQMGILEKKRELADSLFPAIELEGIDPVEAAAWFGVCRLLLNLDEFITRG